MLITDDIVRDLIKAGLMRIQISIDAQTSTTYNLVRPGGKLERVVENIERIIRIRNELQSITPLIRVNFVRTELNEHELQSFIKYWSNKVEMIGIQEMIKPPVSSTEIKSKTTYDKRKKGFRCSFPFKLMVITNEGDILPCCTFYGESMKMGNIKYDSIIEVWISERMKKLRNIHKNGRYYDNETCRKCVEGAIIDNE